MVYLRCRGEAKDVERAPARQANGSIKSGGSARSFRGRIYSWNAGIVPPSFKEREGGRWDEARGRLSHHGEGSIVRVIVPTSWIWKYESLIVR